MCATIHPVRYFASTLPSDDPGGAPERRGAFFVRAHANHNMENSAAAGRPSGLPLCQDSLPRAGTGEAEKIELRINGESVRGKVTEARKDVAGPGADAFTVMVDETC
jgi:hypothetical protein